MPIWTQNNTELIKKIEELSTKLDIITKKDEDFKRKLTLMISRIEERGELTLDDLEPIKRMANEWNQE